MNFPRTSVAITAPDREQMWLSHLGQPYFPSLNEHLTQTPLNFTWSVAVRSTSWSWGKVEELLKVQMSFQ